MKPTFVETLDAVEVAKKSGMPLAPIMIYGDDVTHLLTEEGIARIRSTRVVTVMVEGEAEGGGACAEFERVAAMLSYLFRNHKRDAFVMTLHNMLAGYFSRRESLFLIIDCEGKEIDPRTYRFLSNCRTQNGRFAIRGENGAVSLASNFAGFQNQLATAPHQFLAVHFEH